MSNKRRYGPRRAKQRPVQIHNSSNIMDNRPGAHAIRGQNYPGPGAINAYICAKCGALTVVRHVDAGVTPMFLACRRPSGCDEMARSAGYPPNPPQKVIDAVRWEWYRPDHTEFDKLDQVMKDHIKRGGLILRPVEKE